MVYDEANLFLLGWQRGRARGRGRGGNVICFTHVLSRDIAERFARSAFVRVRLWPRCHNGLELDRELFAPGQNRRLEQAHLSMPLWLTETLERVTSLYAGPDRYFPYCLLWGSTFFLAVFDSSRCFIWRNHRRKGSEPDWSKICHHRWRHTFRAGMAFDFLCKESSDAVLW